jgi:hypothetical protein
MLHVVRVLLQAACHKTQLTDLDDACLLGIFKHLVPLPDLFQVAQTCWVSACSHMMRLASAEPLNFTHEAHTLSKVPSEGTLDHLMSMGCLHDSHL